MKRGFTLVELSIVLVIIGLLIGGILVAQSMISTARIQSQVRQLEQYNAATSNFKSRYNQIPGDCNLCNHTNDPSWKGNNDGKFIDVNGVVPPVDMWIEPVYFFADLYQMGHLTTKYQMIGSEYDFGENKEFPIAAIRTGGLVVTSNNFGAFYYTFIYRGTTIDERQYFKLMDKGIFSPAEALALDSKLDDGNPVKGDIQATSATSGAITDIIPFLPETDDAVHCVNGGQYNVKLAATDLCRPVIKASFH